MNVLRWNKQTKHTIVRYSFFYIVHEAVYLLMNWQERSDHLFSPFAKFSEKLTFLFPWYADLRVRIRG